MPYLTLEDGSGVAGANSYVSVAFADEYFLTHPYSADMWDALGTPEKERFLVTATMVLDSMFNWYGRIAIPSQTLGWPRIGVYDRESRIVPFTSVPLQVKQAVCELALHYSKGDPFAPPSSTGLESLKIDVVELKFGQSTKPVPVPAPALTLLKGLGDYVYGSRIRKVLVG